jgi:hypothetical protein
MGGTLPTMKRASFAVIRLCASELLEKVPEPQCLNGEIHKRPERRESRRQD